MDITSILTSLGGVGAFGGLFAWLGNRALNRTVAKINESTAKMNLAQAEINSAQADVTSADYVEKIIAQADKRVEQYEADAKNWREKITETEAYAKEQRMANNTLREEKAQLKESLHKSELRIRDLEHALVVAEWAKCTDDICKKRIPPRIHDKPKE